MRILLLGIFLIALCFGSNSCQKEFTISDVDSSLITLPGTTPIDSTGSGSMVTGNFTAKIDGVQFVANKVAEAARTLNIISITGQDSNGQLIVFTVADSGAHVYSLDINTSSNAAAYSETPGAISYTSNSGSTSAQSGGTLSITSIDTVNKKMSGTFSVKVFREVDELGKNITEGVFNNISYETQALPPANSSDTFKVKVDGTDFPVYSIGGINAANLINISASDQAVSKSVGLSFPATLTPGTYSFDLFQSYIGQYNIGSSYLTADDGSFTILEYNTSTKRVRGSFSFHAAELGGTQMANLTEGYFSVTYQ